MENKEDEELERIKRAKPQEMKKGGAEKKQKLPMGEPVEVKDATFKDTIRHHSLMVVDCWAA